MYYPDSPTPVSPDFLKKIDQDAPGTWLGSIKADGFRRICQKNGKVWHISGKKGGTGEHVKMPNEIADALAEYPWPENITLDCEWIGRRMIEHVAHEYLYVFDILDGAPAIQRLSLLNTFGMLWGDSVLVKFMPVWTNPGLFDRFQEQMTNPLSEGLVVRRADSRHLMGRNGCKTNPHCLKIKYRNIREQTHVKEQP